jgi:hypothetical protein
MTTPHTFELRTYQSAPGKLDALSARFRDHTLKLFATHDIGVTGFWVAPDADDSSSGTLVYICVYDSRAAADAAWDNFRDDPEWQRVKAETERDGSLTTSVESLFVEPTDYSPIR